MPELKKPEEMEVNPEIIALFHKYTKSTGQMQSDAASRLVLAHIQLQTAGEINKLANMLKSELTSLTQEIR